jgi:hypothetical protein
VPDFGPGGLRTEAQYSQPLLAFGMHRRVCDSPKRSGRYDGPTTLLVQIGMRRKSVRAR